MIFASSCACACAGSDVPSKPGCRSRSRCKGADLRGYDASQVERLRKIHDRLSEARRELDALIGDAYLRPRANIVPVHFLDLASAVEKLRWAEKEWRELDKELAANGQRRLEDLVEVGRSESSAR